MWFKLIKLEVDGITGKKTQILKNHPTDGEKNEKLKKGQYVRGIIDVV